MNGKKDVLAQELKFAKLLASNDQKIRNNVLKSLKKWLNTRSQSSYQFSDNDFLRLWKGLYYCMWMSDKPLVQEELSEELGSLLHCFPNIKIAIQFFQAFLETMCIEWFGIDQWRIDKFMMLVRRVTRQMLFAIKNVEWEDEALKLFSNALNKTVFQVNKCPKSLIFHICDLYIEEIAKVSDGELAEDRTHLLIEPFLVYYTKLNDPIALNHVEKTIVNQLLFQSSLGQEYQEKFDIWKQANFPTKSIDDLEIKYQVRGNKSSNDDDMSDGQEEDLEERPLDPRAGRVNVSLNEIPFDALKFAEAIENLRYKQFATSKSRKGLARMADHFRRFANDIFPLGVKIMPQENNDDDESAIDLDLKAIQLAEFEKKLAIGDVDSESSDFDEDLDNRKHGKLKRKNKDENTVNNKVKEKKQKLSKLHNERFFKTKEDFTQDTVNAQPEEEEEEPKAADIKIKKKKKKVTEENTEVPRKIKKQKRKNLPETTVEEKEQEVVEELPKKALKLNKTSSPSAKGSTQPFQVTDEWSEPLKDGEVEMFVPSRKQKLKALQQAEEKEKKSSKLVLNPFAKSSGLGKKSKNKGSADDTEAATSSQIFATPPPRIKLQESSTSKSNAG
ncbi:ribosomal RNA processing protein 1 homolog isoform X2 [Chironomus tepperi]|uniref:ribosomal RNA processing protein 1 homolog isoform X2 n=1 Tax=Chironomus tepperi TaxID=113505 RepID=UPI00391F80C5